MLCPVTYRWASKVKIFINWYLLSTSKIREDVLNRMLLYMVQMEVRYKMWFLTIYALRKCVAYENLGPKIIIISTYTSL